MILGVVTVALFGEAMISVKFLGTMFLNALKMIVIPLLFCSMIVGISRLGDIRKLGRTGLKTMLYFLVTSSIAVAIGLILVNVIQPGVGFGIFGAGTPEAIQSRESYSFFTWLTNQIPSNIIGAAAETKVLPVIFFALFFGGVLTTLGAKGKPVIAFFEGINEAIMKIVHIIMWFAPIGIFGLVAGQLAAQGGMSGFSGVLSALGKYSLVVILGLIIHGVIILPLILKFMGGKNPIEYFVGMSQALMTAFATASSSATLPVSIDCVEEKNDIDKRASSFVLPLGATINMDGTALYEAVAAMFIAQAYGIDLTILSQIVIFATAVLASIGAAGIPEAGLVTMVIVLQAVGLPLEGIGLILAIDWFLDRCRTTVNVWGDSIGAAVIATTAEIGLVDRLRLRKARTERSDRGRSYTRRKDPRYKKKTQDSAAGPRKDRKPSRGKKFNGSGKETTRRPGRPAKKSHRGDARRSSVSTPVDSGFSQTPKREEYRPKDDTTREKVVKLKSEKSDRPAVAEKKSATGSNQQKPPFGRKRQRPVHSRKKTQEENNKRSKPENDAEPSSAKEEKKAFVIPRFPDTILDDLESVQEHRENAEQNDDAGRKFDSSEVEAEPDNVVVDAKIETHLKDDAVLEEVPQISEDVAGDAGQAEEEIPEKDFSKLDEAVLGTLSKSDSQPEIQPSLSGSEPEFGATESEMPSENTEVSEPEPRKEESFMPEPSAEAAVSDETPTNSERDFAENVENGDKPLPEKTSPAETSSEMESESSATSGADETVEKESEAVELPDADASKDSASKEETMRWGRSKRKKLNR
jgi:Na+/H+-dicarboxylate symporter